ncbi:MAG TPA: hypothetical protein VGO62_16700, partial [Myxococcota bacterium]
MLRALLLTSAALCMTSCTAPSPSGPAFSMSFARARSLYDAPFPSDDLVQADGTVDLHALKNDNNADIIARSLALITTDARGFAQAGAIYFKAGAALDAHTLPSSLSAGIASDASVYVVAVDAASPAFLVRTPVQVQFLVDGGPYGDTNLLAILPLQGAPLLAHTRYAAVVTRAIRDTQGLSPAQPVELQALAAGKVPAGLSAAVAHEYTSAIAALVPLAKSDDIAALAVFTTDDSAATLTKFLADALAHHPIAVTGVPALTDTFDSYCVFQAGVQVPMYQHGDAPYTESGGNWTVDDTGAPVFDHTESGRLFFTVPRAAEPASGYPTVFFIGTGAGGERALVDRGVCATADFTSAIAPGTGPAQEFARVGWAGVQIDGDMEGPRTPTGGNEDFLIFNVFNPPALRDNVRQSALEIALLPSALADFHFDASACPDTATDVRIDFDNAALMGHSMGAAIAPLVLAVQPQLHTAILSGAGSSYIANIMDKQLPLHVRPVAEDLLKYDQSGRALTPFDPALTIFQWAAEPSDAQIYDGALQPRNILMLQGIVDHYILPSIAEATSLSMGLDLAGAAIDHNAELAALGQTSVTSLLPLVHRSVLAFPAADNQGNGATAVLVQNPGDDV